jgi:hypothetical protein
VTLLTLKKEVWIQGEGIHAEVVFDDLPPAPPPVAPAPVFVTTREPTQEQRRGRALTPTTIGLFGGGIAALGFGVIAGVMAANEHSDSDRQCPSGRCTVEGAAAEDRASNWAWASTGGIVVGTGLVLLATTLWLTSRAK